MPQEPIVVPPVGPDLDVAVVPTDDHVVVAVSGELDVATGGRLKDVLMATVAASPRGVVLDLDGISFMDSTGLSVTIAGRRRAEAVGTRMEVVCSRPEVVRLFAVTGLDDYITVHPSVPAAVAALDRPSG